MMEALRAVTGIHGEEVVASPELPDALVNSARQGQRYHARREWQRRKDEGKVPEDERPPDGPTLGSVFAESVIFGVVGLFAGAILALIIGGISRLFGAHLGAVGYVVVIAPAVAGVFGGARWQVLAWERHVAVLEANQRTVTSPAERWQMADARRTSETINEIWPHIPECDWPVIPLLNTTLWQLAGALLRRRDLAGTLADLRKAAVGVPAATSTARTLAAQTAYADRQHAMAEARVQHLTGGLSDLATECQQFRDAEAAITQGKKVALSATTVLGTASLAAGDGADDVGERAARVAAVNNAYRNLAAATDAREPLA